MEKKVYLGRMMDEANGMRLEFIEKNGVEDINLEEILRQSENLDVLLREYSESQIKIKDNDAKQKNNM